MAKKPTTEIRDVAKVATKVRDVANFEMTEAVADLAARLGMDVSVVVTPEQRIDRAAHNMSLSAQYLLAVGVDLIALRSQVERGRFGELLEDRGFGKDAAYRAMQYAAFLASRPAEEQVRLMALPKFKVLELAKADPEVLDTLMDEDGPVDLSATNIRDLRARIHELESGMVDVKVQRDTAEAERDAAIKRLQKANNTNRDDQVPHMVADLRAELAVLAQTAKRAIDACAPIGVDLVNLAGIEEAQPWIEPTAAIAMAGLISIHVQLKSQIERWADAFQLQGFDVEKLVDPAYGLTDAETLDVARQWDSAMRTADYEAELRKWEREQERPRAKGRPTAKPVPPKGYEK